MEEYNDAAGRKMALSRTSFAPNRKPTTTNWNALLLTI